MSHHQLILVQNDREPILLATCQSTVSTVVQRSGQNVAIKDLSRNQRFSDAVKCPLFQSFCTSFYCSSLWSSYVETLKMYESSLQQDTVVSRYYDITGVDKIYRIIRTIVITIRPYLDKFQLVGDNTSRKVANCISSKVLLQ